MATYLVQVDLPANPIPMDLCRCLTVDSLAAILRALEGSQSYPAVRVIVQPDDAVRGLLGAGEVACAAGDVREVCVAVRSHYPTDADMDAILAGAYRRLMDALPPF